MNVYTAPELIVVDLKQVDVLTASLTVVESGEGDDWDWGIYT